MQLDAKVRRLLLRIPDAEPPSDDVRPTEVHADLGLGSGADPLLPRDVEVDGTIRQVLLVLRSEPALTYLGHGRGADRCRRRARFAASHGRRFRDVGSLVARNEELRLEADRSRRRLECDVLDGRRGRAVRGGGAACRRVLVTHEQSFRVSPHRLRRGGSSGGPRTPVECRPSLVSLGYGSAFPNNAATTTANTVRRGRCVRKAVRGNVSDA